MRFALLQRDRLLLLAIFCWTSLGAVFCMGRPGCIKLARVPYIRKNLMASKKNGNSESETFYLLAVTFAAIRNPDREHSVTLYLLLWTMQSTLAPLSPWLVPIGFFFHRCQLLHILFHLY